MVLARAFVVAWRFCNCCRCQCELKLTGHFSFHACPSLSFSTCETAPLSFAADYLSMTHDTYIHTADRLLACPMMVFELAKVITMFPHVRTGTFSLYVLSVSVAVYSFIKSSQAQDNHDANGFIFWHNCWHLYPLVICVIMGYDFFVLGEYDRATRGTCSAAHKPKARRPLSAVVMENTAHARTPGATSTPLRRSAKVQRRTNAINSSC